MAKKKDTTEEPATEGTTNTDTVSAGDVIRIHLVGRVNSHEGPVFQVTDEEVAREEGMLEENSNRRYEPRLVVVGKGQVIDGIDEALVGMKVGEEKKVEIPPEKAFGNVDPKKRRVMAFRDFRKRFKKAPRVGEFVEFPDTHAEGRVVNINQGKVVIDMNHFLAGKTVYYTIKVVEKLEGDDAKLKALIEQRLQGIPVDQVKFEFSDDGKQLDITLPQIAFLIQQSGFMQYLLGMDIQREYEELEKVRFIVELEKPKVPEGGAADGNDAKQEDDEAASDAKDDAGEKGQDDKKDE